ncbi:MAG: hypothetical protein RLZZ361_625 [Cyanobacteriota bacterium]|jgi:phosphoribosylaminoimidazolecarboxamide formyltransferase/IMP cyclohydrolase
MSKKALISVSDKSGLDNLLNFLVAQDYEFVSTGGTAKHIKSLGYTVQEVSELTKFPELFDGRVKTLHPKILGGILARRDQEKDLIELIENEIEKIDLVIVNLYPFEEVISSPEGIFATAIENIDIGGPTLLRSAGKNFESITVLCKPSQYQLFIDQVLKYGYDSVEMLALREKLAIDVFEECSRYDAVITEYLKKQLLTSPVGASFNYNKYINNQVLVMPQQLSIELELSSPLRYGENPHQKAALYRLKNSTAFGFGDFKQLGGKEVSFNNLLDMESAWNIVSEYDSSIPCIAIIKHNNPCGVAIAPSPGQAFLDALSSDPVSAFGGVVGSNVVIDLNTANEMTQIFLEAVIAPDFSPEALEVLATKPNLRLITINKPNPKTFYDIKAISGAYLVQEFDQCLHNPEEIKVVTEKQVEDHQWVDLLLAWKIVKHVKSNAIVAVLNGKTLGIGCGQTNRVKSVKDALANFDFDTRGAVLASDGFFPFADNIDIAAQNHISAIIQPGGSIRDQEVISACNKYGIAMVFTKIRHFKH